MGLEFRNPNAAASPKQFDYITDLLAATATPYEIPKNLTMQQAGEIIDTLRPIANSREFQMLYGTRVPPLTIVESSNVRGMAWDRGNVFVRFNNGGLYRFHGVPSALFLEWLATESKGKFFHASIKGKYHYVKLNKEDIPEKLDVAEGFYAVDHADGKLRFYEVSLHQYKKTKQVKQLFGSPGSFRKELIRDPFPTLRAILNAGPVEAQKRFSSELGCCAYCGSPLTDALSRERGIGPICWGKYGAYEDAQ